MNKSLKLLMPTLRFSVLVSLLMMSATAEESVIRDIEYAATGNRSLKLDFHQPPDAVSELRPLIIWIHGGAWRAGSKDNVPLTPMLTQGYAIASVEYRLTPEAPFPAQIHDIRAAIRFLRSRASVYRIDPDRFVIAGASAGGHLAALVGVSHGIAELEGTVGDHPESSSAVQAIVSFYGASNLTSILSQSTPHGLSVRVPALQLLLGGQPDQKPELAKLASPVAHVDASDPPLWLIHGDRDPQMPFEQSMELMQAYRALSLPVQLDVIAGGVHGGPEFFSDKRLRKLAVQLTEVMTPAAARK